MEMKHTGNELMLPSHPLLQLLESRQLTEISVQPCAALLHSVLLQKPFAAIRSIQRQVLEKELEKGWQLLLTLASIYSCTPRMVRDG